MIVDSRRRSETIWSTKAPLPLNSRTLEMLLNNQIPIIQIKQFATEKECEQLVYQANLNQFDSYQNVSPKIERIGITVFEYKNISKEAYFEAAKVTWEKQRQITSESFDPLKRLMNMIDEQTALRTRIASEQQYGEDYYAGLIRKIEKGTQLHIDYAPLEQPEWDVSKITSQLSWNLYLQAPVQKGGKTYIYDRKWQPQDEQYKLDSYGYDEIVIEDSIWSCFQPTVGDVFLFNTQNYHLVEPTEGHRMTFTSAMGLLQNQEIIFWS